MNSTFQNPQVLEGKTSSIILAGSGILWVSCLIYQQQRFSFVITKKSRVRIAVKETYPKQIAFSLVEGNLKSLQGSWRIEPVSPYPGAPSKQVLITHQVNADPGAISTRGLFYSVYKDSLESTMVALKKEVERRSAKK